MKGKLQSSKNKRMIALVAILVVLLAGTVTGVTLFLKDDGSTSATAYNEISNNTIQEPTNSTTGQEEQTIPTDEDEQQTIPTDENQQQETTSEQTTPEGQGNQETTTSNNQENTENNNADSQTTPEESITYADRLVSEDFLVGWTPIGLATIADTTGRYLNNTKLEIEKISYTETDFTNNTEISLPEQSKYNSVQSGERIVYEIRVKNTSNVVAKNIKIIDKIPEGIIVEEIDSNGTLKNENVQWVSDIPAGEQVSFKFVAVVEENVEGTIQNIAVVNGDATNTVHNPVLKTEKIAEVTRNENIVYDAAKPGDTINYIIQITNTGNVDAVTKVTDQIPANTTLVENSITDNGIKTNGNIDWDEVIVKPGETKNIEFKVTVNKDVTGSIKNIAVVGETPTNETENLSANITGRKTVDKTEAKVGDTIKYTITLTNSGNAAGKVTVTDKIPEGTTIKDDTINGYNKETNEMVWEEVEVASGASVELTLEVVVNKETTTSVINTAILDGEEIPDKPETKVANITGRKTVDKTEAKVGDTIKYTITLTNSGNAAGKVTVTDKIPEGTTIKDDTINGYNKETNEMVWEEVEVASGASVELTLEVVINKGTTTSVINTAIIDGEEIPDKPETKVANITGRKTVDKTEAKVGDTIKYTITLTNSGNAAGKVTVTDKIPEGTTIKDETIEGYNKETNEMVWEEVEVAAGGRVELTLEVIVNKDTTTSVINTATIDEEEIPDKPETKIANITGSKTADKTEAKVGETIKYTITLTNSGNAAGKVTVTDKIPEGTTIKDETIEGYNKETNEMVWEEVEVAAGGRVELTLEVIVNKDTTTSVINTAAIDEEEIPDKPETKIANITAQKVSKHEEELTEDGIIQYTITLTNSGNAAGKVTVTDKIPEGTTYVEKSVDEKGTYNKTTNTIEWKDIEVKPQNPVELTFNVKVKPFENGETEKEIANQASIGNKVVDKADKKYIEKEISKVWENDNETLRNDIIVEIYANNVKTNKTLTLQAEEQWKGTFKNLPKYDSAGKEIVYTIKEVNVPEGYTSTVNGMTITNTYTEPTVSKTVIKEWVGDNDSTILRQGVTVEILADGQKEETVVLNSTNNWQVTVTGLQKYKTGTRTPIKYTLNEITKLEGYKTTYDITQEGELIVKNTYEEPTVTKTARKTWVGDNANLRPESITVQLLANGNEVSGKTAILTAGNNWTAEFTGLQKYETGTIKEVKYSIAEVDVPDGYTCRVDTKDSMHLINNYIEPTISKTVTKEWVDNNDLLQERPTSIKIQLKDNTGYVWAEQVITSANKGKDTNTWSWTFTDLPKYDSNNADRKQIIYIVDEAEVQTGDLKYYTKAINNNKIVNTIKVPNIVSTKTATTSADEKTKLINENAVQVGDTITYTIKIENKGEIYKTVTVRDTIPEKTTLQGSIKLDGVDLTEEQVNQLYEGTLALTISEGTYKTITFTVEVVSGNAGDSVTNTAYVDNEAVGPVENPIEKFVNVTKYKNNVGSTNILLVLDTSSSMVNNKVNGQTRLKIAKDAIIDFITKTYEKEANKDVTFTLVTFNKRENTKVFTFGNNNSYIATKDTAEAFKTAISKITNGNGTNMRAGLEVAYTTLFGSDGNGGIAGMPQYKDYEQIMIFFGDGEPSGETNLLNNATGIKAKADEIRAKAKVYAIGFGADAAIPGKVGYERLTDIGGGVVYTSNNYTQLVTNFSEIISADPEYKQVTVNGNAIVEITNSQNIVVDGDKNKIILTVGDKNIEITNSTEAAANYLTYTDKKITWDVSSYSLESILKISYHVQ